jgi:hypothetical protein
LPHLGVDACQPHVTDFHSRKLPVVGQKRVHM